LRNQITTIADILQRKRRNMIFGHWIDLGARSLPAQKTLCAVTSGSLPCFCQFKIDQARQLNFDQGLKPVF